MTITTPEELVELMAEAVVESSPRGAGGHNCAKAILRRLSAAGVVLVPVREPSETLVEAVADAIDLADEEDTGYRSIARAAIKAIAEFKK